MSRKRINSPIKTYSLINTTIHFQVFFYCNCIKNILNLQQLEKSIHNIPEKYPAYSQVLVEKALTDAEKTILMCITMAFYAHT